MRQHQDLDARSVGVSSESLVPEGLTEIWVKHRPEMFERVSVIERAVRALVAGELDEPLRSVAQRAAHTLVGSAGTFGFQRASEVAREIELWIAAPALEQAPSISALVLTLRDELESDAMDPAAEVPVAPDARRTQRTQMLVVDGDSEFCAGIAAAAGSLKIDCDFAATPEQARVVCAERTPTIVLLDLSARDYEMADAYELLSELTTGISPIPVLVLAGSDVFTDRVEAARRGGRAFLAKSLGPAAILDAAVRSLARERLQATRVLLVDDDLAMLDATRALLERHEIEVSTLADPSRFWEALEEASPELLVLDVDMPGVNGAELCRVVRSDPRWDQLAVIFVTAHTDSETVQALFRAGADDYLSKPLLEGDLMTRLSNRLDRVRFHRLRAETDSLTGLANRARSSEGLAQLLSLAKRFSQPLSVAMLDLDHFKQVNDTYGHAAGDAALRGLGERLRQEFRGDDVVGRWGGEEFIVGMYGMTRENGVRRLTETLQRFRADEFVAGEQAFRVSFSAGVAEYPRDARDLDAITVAADAALYRAKDAGRAQVLPVDRQSES